MHVYLQCINAMRRKDNLMDNILGSVRDEIKAEVGKALNIKGFISDILEDYGIENYDNASKMFEWAPRYENLHNIESLDSLKSFKVHSGAWKFPIVIDYKSDIAFTFMKESNLSQKRKETKKTPPHYSKRLSMLNKPIFIQKSLNLLEQKTSYDILKEICPSIPIEDIPENLRMAIITFDSRGDEVIKITAGVYDNNLNAIDIEDWSQYIVTDYLEPNNKKQQLLETVNAINNNVVGFEQRKEDLIEFIDNKNDSSIEKITKK